MWTETTEVDEYCTFLDNLLDIIAQQQKEETGAPVGGGGGGGGDGDGDSAAAALGQRFGWRAVEEIESLSPLLKQWAQPEDEEEAVELTPTKPDDQARLPPPRRTSARPSSRPPVAPATRPGRQADAAKAPPQHKARASTKAGATKAGAATKVGSGHTTSRTAPQTEAPARKNASRTNRVGGVGSVGGAAPAGARGVGGAPAGQLKSLSSAPIANLATLELADFTGCKMLLSSPLRSSLLKGAVNAQRALMAMQDGGAQHAVVTDVPITPATGREKAELTQPQRAVFIPFWPYKKVDGAYVALTMPPPAAGALASLGVYDEYERARASTPIARPMTPPTPGVMTGNIHNSCHPWSDISNSRLAHGGGYAGGGMPPQLKSRPYRKSTLQYAEACGQCVQLGSGCAPGEARVQALSRPATFTPQVWAARAAR